VQQGVAPQWLQHLSVFANKVLLFSTVAAALSVKNAVSHGVQLVKKPAMHF